MVRWVDLTPRVEQDFFFAENDPQIADSRELARRFPAPEQILVRAAGADPATESGRRRLRALTDALAGVPGIERVYSVVTEDAQRSPLWRRLLLTEDSAVTNLVATTDGRDGRALVPALEAVLADHRDGDLDLAVSGVPVIVEQIRRNLTRDLAVFTLAALVLFGLVTAVVQRSARLVAGTYVTGLLAASITLLLVRLTGGAIGLLTANLITIVFVLALSHTVFLTAGGRRHAWDAHAAVRTTVEGSFWAMLTTLLGFLSLLLADARPLRELGWAGAVGTLVAFACAYGAFPAFFPASREGGAHVEDELVPDVTDPATPPARVARPGRRPLLAALALALVGLAAGLPRLATDPGLLTYFDADGPIRSALERIDADGGSAPLLVSVRPADGSPVDTRD
ncbi:MAG: hypothetical protein D6701_11455, partial [Gemmatimonadetes bacterium]